MDFLNIRYNTNHCRTLEKPIFPSFNDISAWYDKRVTYRPHWSRKIRFVELLSPTISQKEIFCFRGASLGNLWHAYQPHLELVCSFDYLGTSVIFLSYYHRPSNTLRGSKPQDKKLAILHLKMVSNTRLVSADPIF